MQAVFYVFSVMLGFVVGSFVNVVVYRVPRNESIVRPRSRCPGCGAVIRWYDNIPVASWLILRGRCRACATRISPQYFGIEVLCGTLFGVAAWRFGLEWRVLVAWAFLASLIAVAFIDLEHMIIPNKIVLPGAVIGLGASIALDPGRWWVYLVSSVGAAAFVFILALIWAGGMGPGDIKMALFMGAVLGTGVIVGLFAAFLLGSLVGIFLIATKRRSRKSTIPFGPFLALGSALALFVGRLVIDSYLNIL